LGGSRTTATFYVAGKSEQYLIEVKSNIDDAARNEIKALPLKSSLQITQVVNEKQVFLTGAVIEDLSQNVLSSQLPVIMATPKVFWFLAPLFAW
jgi:hypothetical protein